VSQHTLEAIALALTGIVHIVGAAILVWALLDGDSADLKKLLRPDGDGGIGRPGTGPKAPVAPRGGLPVPLPDAEQAALRLREAGRLADARPRPERRPQHVPAPAPAREGEPLREPELV
jgi:hypothetical protein